MKLKVLLFLMCNNCLKGCERETSGSRGGSVGLVVGEDREKESEEVL